MAQLNSWSWTKHKIPKSSYLLLLLGPISNDIPENVMIQTQVTNYLWLLLWVLICKKQKVVTKSNNMHLDKDASQRTYSVSYEQGVKSVCRMDGLLKPQGKLICHGCIKREMEASPCNDAGSQIYVTSLQGLQEPQISTLNSQDSHAQEDRKGGIVTLSWQQWEKEKMQHRKLRNSIFVSCCSFKSSETAATIVVMNLCNFTGLL